MFKIILKCENFTMNSQNVSDEWTRKAHTTNRTDSDTTKIWNLPLHWFPCGCKFAPLFIHIYIHYIRICRFIFENCILFYVFWFFILLRRIHTFCKCLARNCYICTWAAYIAVCWLAGRPAMCLALSDFRCDAWWGVLSENARWNHAYMRCICSLQLNSFWFLSRK